MKAYKYQILRDEKNGDPARAITRVGRIVCELYGMGLDVDDHDYFVSSDLSRSLFSEPFRALAFSRSKKRTNSSSA